MANQDHLAILRKGVEAWNQWRLDNETVWPDLGEAKLSGAHLNRADLSGARLGRAQLSRADLREANLRQANFSASI